jgi:hypothetical protein
MNAPTNARESGERWILLSAASDNRGSRFGAVGFFDAHEQLHSPRRTPHYCAQFNT